MKKDHHKVEAKQNSHRFWMHHTQRVSVLTMFSEWLEAVTGKAAFACGSARGVGLADRRTI